MDLGIIISLIIGFVSLVFAFILEGGTLSALLEPTAAMIVFGGTIGAVGVAFPTSILKNIPKIILVAFKNNKEDKKKIIENLKEISVKTRKHGFLELEKEISNKEQDSFVEYGLKMIVDGVDQDIVRSSLESKIESISDRHRNGAAIFESAGGFAPTMGIIGTVMGLVHVLGNLSKPDELGPKIAVAFIATLYGVASANLLWLPLGNKLKELDKEEMLCNTMKMEGIMLIQAGANPSMIEDKLKGYVE